MNGITRTVTVNVIIKIVTMKGTYKGCDYA
jgi:hypothetical protein